MFARTIRERRAAEKVPNEFRAAGNHLPNRISVGHYIDRKNLTKVPSVIRKLPFTDPLLRKNIIDDKVIDAAGKPT